ncbi:MAG: hypothetical protein WD767_20405 [Alphaproteobacteria bacterium]
MDWPALPDGTVDWMTVFQAPGTGLIAQIEQSTTSAQLKACFGVIIEALFSRRNDSEIRAAYHKVADELFGNAADDSALDAQKTKLRMVMMRLMNDRMQRSRAHVAVQAGKGTAADEARLADVDPLAPLQE